MSKRDYYETLQIERTVTVQEIKKAYRKLAVKYHPDKNPGDAAAEERFKEAAEAYAVLSDTEKRARYDRFGHAGVGGAGAAGGGFDPTIFADFSDILGDLFGFGGGRRRGGRSPQRGADLRYDLSVSFEEAAFGVSRELVIPRLETCSTCSGSGSQSGDRPQACGTCSGHGQVRFNQGFFTVARTCPQCGGEGVTVSDPCESCRGEGLAQTERKLDVSIPAGVDEGSRLRLTGEGEHGRWGGPQGDLYVVLRVEPHERFQREGSHVLGGATISYAQAVLGGTIDVETLHGQTPLEIPAGTVHGKQFRLRGEGIDRIGRSGRGDHVAQVEIAVPRVRDLDDEERELLSKLGEKHGERLGREGGVLGKVKKKMFG